MTLLAILWITFHHTASHCITLNHRRSQSVVLNHKSKWRNMYNYKFIADDNKEPQKKTDNSAQRIKKLFHERKFEGKQWKKYYYFEIKNERRPYKRIWNMQMKNETKNKHSSPKYRNPLVVVRFHWQLDQSEVPILRLFRWNMKLPNSKKCSYRSKIRLSLFDLIEKPNLIGREWNAILAPPLLPSLGTPKSSHCKLLFISERAWLLSHSCYVAKNTIYLFLLPQASTRKWSSGCRLSSTMSTTSWWLHDNLAFNTWMPMPFVAFHGTQVIRCSFLTSTQVDARNTLKAEKFEIEWHRLTFDDQFLILACTFESMHNKGVSWPPRYPSILKLIPSVSKINCEIQMQNGLLQSGNSCNKEWNKKDVKKNKPLQRW